MAQGIACLSTQLSTPRRNIPVSFVKDPGESASLASLWKKSIVPCLPTRAYHMSKPELIPRQEDLLVASGFHIKRWGCWGGGR